MLLKCGPVVAAVALASSIPPVSTFVCDTPSYYQSIQAVLDTPSDASNLKEVLRAHMSETHEVIPYTSNTKTDCWDALSYLDVDPSNSSRVLLIYSQKPDDITDAGDSDGWNREHVWPKSYGVGYTGADTSDLHSLRAADWSVNSARNNRYFDDCTSVEEGCTIPAHSEAAADTGKMSISGTTGIFMPPASVRGDLARSLFYMATRYDGSEANTEDLTLSNCPCDTTFKLGMLSTLLEWHAADPPSAEEVARNGLVCSDFQGNRNVYIDYPDLVSITFTSDDGSSCPTCPEPVSEDDSSDNDFFVESPVHLDLGDLAIVGYNADAPKSVQLLALTDIPSGASFYLTDNGFLGNSFRGGEGTLKFTAAVDIVAGTTLSWVSDDPSAAASEVGAWEEHGSFVLSASGDQLYIFTLMSSMNHNHVFALQYRAAAFDDPMTAGVDDSSTKGALPLSLASGNFAVALTHHDNSRWEGGEGVTGRVKADFLASIVDKSTWSGDDASAFTFSTQVAAYSSYDIAYGKPYRHFGTLCSAHSFSIPSANTIADAIANACAGAYAYTYDN
ncbi:hypothetical protein TrCOL_g4237 [Triparma columacea]|uniref:Uncharacterized protein n=1 Tax=Triparma columacea TaxID=722753 RepID=A0A9W7GJE8_9STRA|nr:hypothetical protein TrCOL_g4237 [Triparma columacea]